MVREQEEKRETEIVMVTCQPNGVRCNICGTFIPDGDFMCGNGHEPGKEYPVSVPRK